VLIRSNPRADNFTNVLFDFFEIKSARRGRMSLTRIHGKKFAAKRNRISHLIDNLESRLLYAGDPAFSIATEWNIREGVYEPNIELSLTNAPDTDFLVVHIERVGDGSPNIDMLDGEGLGSTSFDLFMNPAVSTSINLAAMIYPDPDQDDDVAQYEISAEGFETKTITITQNDTTLGMPDLTAATDDGDFDDDDVTTRNNADAAHKLTFTVTNTDAGDKIFLFVDGFMIGQATATGSTLNISTDGHTVLPFGEHEFAVARQPVEGEEPEFSESAWVFIENDAPIELTKPLNVVASSDLPDMINVVWDEVAFAEGYNLYRGTTATFAGADQIGSFLMDTYYEDFEVEPGVKYYYFVTATAGEDEGPASAAAIGTLQLSPPEFLEATTDLPDRVTLTWDEVAGATSFNIFRSEEDDFSTALKIKTGAVNGTYDDMTAKGGKEYYYWIKAVSAASTSEESFSVLGLLGPAESTITIPKITTSNFFGKPFMFSPTLKSNPVNGPAFTGELQLIDVDTTEILAIGEITGKTAKLVTAPELPVGTYNVYVHYEGDELHLGADSAEFTLTVKAATTTISIKTSLAAPVAGQEITLTADVKSAIAPGYERTGTVSFYDGDELIDTADLSENSASLTFVPTVGNHKFKAVYEGDENFNTSTSAIKASKVNKAKTKLVATPSMLSPILVGDTFDVTAVIQIVAPGAADPTGMITFKDNGVVIGQVAVVGGEATFSSIMYTKVGTHKFVATFSGDENTMLSTSTAFTIKVLPGIARRFS
jgi:hypothetical protein